MILVSLIAVGQGGIIKGKVVDGKNMPLAFARVLVIGTETAAQTGFEGEFTLNVEAGVHSIKITPMELSLGEKIENNIKVLAGATVDLGIIKIEADPAGKELTTTVIKVAKTGTESEEDALKKKFEQNEIVEEISQEKMDDLGVSDAAEGAKSSPGVSVEGGKYVYVRGLGDRYNKTTLNGLEIPGLDPDKNAVQMDIFPSNVIGGLTIKKSFVADLPADFAGGIIDIQVKTPSKRDIGISTSLGYLPAMHFNSDYYAYDRNSGDVLGNGASSRAIPEYNLSQDNITLMNKFDAALAPYQKSSLLDYSLGAHLGNKKVLNKGSLAYTVALSYSEKTRFYQDVEQNRYALATNPDITDLITRSTQKGDYGTNEVLATALGGLTYSMSEHTTFNFSAMRLQNGLSQAGVFDFEAPTNDPFKAIQYNLEYNERTLSNFFVGGKHTFSDSSKWELEWKLSPTFSSMNDPDIRSTRYNLSNATPYGTEAGLPTRIWRNMQESNYAGKVDVTRAFKFNDTIAKVKFGGAATMKERDFQIEFYQILVNSLSNLGMGTDPNEIFMDENVFGSSDAPAGSGFYAGPPSSFTSSDPNKFNSSSAYFAGYVATELMLTKKLEAIAGVRVEQFSINYTGYNDNEDKYAINQKMLDNLDVFPALAFAYNISENQKFRLSGTKTIARPSFKEMSFASIIDPISGITFLGGMNAIDDWDGNLVKTDIYNADVRWEIVMKQAQTVSISSFYKYFSNPIEMIQIAGADGNFQPRNVGNAEVFGAEFEGKKQLNFISDKLKRFAVIFNYTYTSSRVKMSNMVRNSKEQNKRSGEVVGDYRDMAGQAPYLINGGFAYEGPKDSSMFSFFKFGVYYNVQGKTLQYVGITERPDVYSVPFHSLNFTASKKFGPKKQYKINVKASNLLNDIKEKVFVSYNTSDQIFSSITPAQSFKIGFSMKF